MLILCTPPLDASLLQVMPTKTQAALCGRDDAKGTNPTTQVDTRESLMCPD